MPSFLRTLEITQSGAIVYDRLPSGLIITWVRSGTYPDYTWSTSDCNVTTRLTKNQGGYFEVTTLWGDVWLFTASGMPDMFTSRNGNVTDFAFSGYLLTPSRTTSGTR